MTDQQGRTTTGLSNLAEGAVSDIERLLSLHLDLLKAEMKQEVRQARDAAASLAAGAGASAAAGILGSLAAVHLVQRLTGLPLWACYALVGGGLGLAGAEFLRTGVKQAAGVNLLPEHTVRTVKEELAGARF